MRHKILFSIFALMASLDSAPSNAEPAALGDDLKKLAAETRQSVEKAVEEKKIIPPEPPNTEIKDAAPSLENSKTVPENSEYVGEEEFKNTKTLMFKSNDHEKIIKVFTSYRNKNKNKIGNKKTVKETEDILSDALSRLGDQKTGDEQVVKVPAYFFLDSIIFQKGRSPKIWVNGRKLEINQQIMDLKFVSATAQAAKFIWQVPPGVDTSEWADRADNPANKTESKIEINASTGEVEFSLKPNQWFDATKTRIVEGRAMNSIKIDENDPVFFDPKKAKIEEINPAPIEKPSEVKPQAPEPEKTKEITEQKFVLSSTDSHYHAKVSAGGYSADFVIDTGASVVSVPESMAKKFGIDTKNLKYDQKLQTAGGESKAAKTSLAEIDVEGLKASNIDVWVFNDKDLKTPLLGQNFLNQFEITTKDSVMMLKKPPTQN